MTVRRCAIGVYTMIGIDAAALLLWLLAGFLATGAALSFTLGSILLPLSVPGVMLCGVGLIGMIPFLTTFVYARSFWNVVRGASARQRRWLPLAIACTASASVLVAAFAEDHVRARCAAVVDAVLAAEAPDTTILRWCASSQDLNRIFESRERTRSPHERDRLGAALEQITGRPIRVLEWRMGD